MSDLLVGDDLSALAWVQGELRRSLEAAHKSLRRYLKEADAAGSGEIDAVDPAVLRGARTQLHQGVGALELVGLPAVADVLRASEAAVQRMIARPAIVNPAAVETIERVSFALLDYLSRLLGRRSVSPVMLFPQYRAVQALAGADRVHPADLWKRDWQWFELPADGSAQLRTADDAAREAMETEVLHLMREPGSPALQRMSDLCADLAAGARAGVGGASSGATGAQRLGTLWQMAAAVFEAQAKGLLGSDVFTKRIASRLLAQLRTSVRGQPELSERLAQDLLFFCGHAKAPATPALAPRLHAVRRVWRLQDHKPVDYDTARLGRFDPAHLALARKRVGAAKDAWSAVAGGEQHRMAGLGEQFSLVGDSLQKLFPAGEVLAQSLQAAAAQTVGSGQPPPAPLAMEVATGILYLDASLEDGELDQPELAERVQRLAQRIDDVRGGSAPQPLDMWMEELYRRVSDRQTMGSVVQELRASLSEVEKQIDQYFRNPAERQVLIPVPAQLSSMRGVLSVLGMDQASAAALHMRDDVEKLAQTEVDPQRAIQAGTFDRLADNLGALSFLIDMLSVQPQLAKSLFRFDPETGQLSSVMGQTERASAFAPLDDAVLPPADEEPAPLLDQVRALGMAAAEPQVPDETLARDAERLAQQALAADQPELARLLGSAHSGLRRGGDAQSTRALRQQLSAAVASLGAPAPEALPAPAPVPPSKPTPAGGTGLEDDPEMRDIFIEEAREVVTDANAALKRLLDAPDNAQELTAVRRAFHTLKGSSRMVGLRDFGDAAWSCEQLFNARLAQAPQMDLPLRQVTQQSLAYLGGWVDAIAEGRNEGHTADAVSRAADALRLDGTLLAVEAPRGAPAIVNSLRQPAPTVPPAVAATPLAGTIVLPASDAAAAPASGEVDFEFSLPELDDDGPRPAAATSLAARVSELPSAADLDLPPLRPAPPEPEFAPDAMTATEVDFDLDLGDFDEAVAAAPPPPAAAAAVAAASVYADLDLPLDAEPDSMHGELVAMSDAGAQALPEAAVEGLEIDLDELEGFDFGNGVVSGPVDLADPAPPSADASPPQAEADEQLKQIGPLRISIPLFNIYLNEADELSRRLVTELAEWAVEADRQPVSDTAVALAHSLAGSSATVGYAELSALARALEHALMRSHTAGHGREGETTLFSAAADEIRRLLHQFAAGFLRPVDPQLMEQLAAHERLPVDDGDSADRSDAPDAAAAQGMPAAMFTTVTLPAANTEAFDADDDIDAVDAIDAELFPIFEEEADELLPQLHNRLREWHDHPGNPGAPAACMRTLHTFKGGARLAGAMRLGEMAHRLETGIEQLSALDNVQAAQVEPLLLRADAMLAAFEALRHAGPSLPAPAPVAPPAPTTAPAPTPAAATQAVDADVEDPVSAQERTAPMDTEAFLSALAAVTPPPAPAGSPLVALLEPLEPLEPLASAEAMAAEGTGRAGATPVLPAPSQPAIDWGRFAQGGGAAVAPAADKPVVASTAAVRVRAGLLDRLVNNAGEVSITRSRIDSNVQLLQGSLAELTDSLERMRRQLRDIELQAETQISTRIEAAKAAAETFDPLEMDRFTRFQELTRFMAESVNDVATLQRGLQRTLQSAEDELAAQARLTRELQDDLLRTRMIEFESLADRLYRTVRQAAKETGKQVRLDIAGGSIEIDRGVLERMAGSFEHLLRNSVAHGVETPAERERAGKDAHGGITVTVAQAGNEVAVDVADDGAGLDLARIRERGIERGLLAEGSTADDAELSQLIFAPGFSTAETVTELAGRGVGLDVVRAEVNAMGGRIETHSEPGRGTRFRLLLPLTTAVTQVVMLRCGSTQVAVPSPLIEVVKRVPTAEVEAAYASGKLQLAGESLPFFWLAALLQAGTRGPDTGRTQVIVVVRSAAQRVAVHVDEVLGNQEVVVKNVGPQLARLPGLAGVTLLPSGAVALIYNPVALATVYADAARALASGHPVSASGGAAGAAQAAEAEQAPMILVVDDSLTVRRVTQRLLVREGYRVVTAKDGLDALERLAEERPVVLLSDIEMPRMDGFDLVRNVRADPKLQGLPVIMITSRIAQKHRDYASELGVDHYLGKPYSEEELLALVSRYVAAQAVA